MTTYAKSWGKDVPILLHANGRKLDLSDPQLMYIVNLTKDSFSDGGKFANTREAIDYALSAVEQGVVLIDLGAESTRPGSRDIPAQDQLKRVLPVLKELRKHKTLWISIDTSDTQVIKRAIDEGADIINDVRALTRPGALQAVASSTAAVCLVHMQGQPATMQNNPSYEDTITEIEYFLLNRVDQTIKAGVRRDRIIIDPGFGFGKTLQDNIELLHNLPCLTEHGFPVLAGLSRKSMLGSITGRAVDRRATASALAGLMALERGANILRVHDLEPSLDALALYRTINKVR